MEAQTDTITAIIFSLCAFVTGGLCFIIWHMYTRILKTQDAFIEALQAVRLEQVEQNNNIRNNHEHIVRLERFQTSHAEEMADHIVTKLKASMGH